MPAGIVATLTIVPRDVDVNRAVNDSVADRRRRRLTFYVLTVE